MKEKSIITCYTVGSRFPLSGIKPKNICCRCWRRRASSTRAWPETPGGFGEAAAEDGTDTDAFAATGGGEGVPDTLGEVEGQEEACTGTSTAEYITKFIVYICEKKPLQNEQFGKISCVEKEFQRKTFSTRYLSQLPSGKDGI